MTYVLVALGVPLFLFAEFNQECRFIRIARNEYVSYSDLLAEMARDKPTVIGTMLFVGSFVALMVAVAGGYRFPDDAVPYAIVAVLLLSGAALKAVGFWRLTRRSRG